jgi:two-component system OmpR family sensor kinase
MLGSAILISGLVAAIASLILAYTEAKEFQDDMLRQIAMLETRNISSPTDMDAPNQNKTEFMLADPESRISVFHLPGDLRPDWLANDLAPGFHTLDTNREHLRVFVKDGPSTKTTVVAQPTDARDEIAMNSALRTLVPLLLFLPVMAWLIVRIIRHELAPISYLAGHMDAQPADRPRPLSDEGVPDEIAPFVHAINRLLKRVNDLMGQQRRFIADAAHELRSPLTALSVQAQNLKQAGSLEAMRQRVLPLEAGIERARKLTEQLLSLAKTQTQTERLTSTKVDVSAMARELIADYLPLAEAKGIDLGLSEAAPLALNAAPETLRLVLRNGLENALKYVPDGGEVTLRLYTDDDSAVMEVVDNGSGIPAAERERVVDPFYRMPSTTGEGSGLGLAIAMEAAASLGGSVSLLDRPEGSGLVFRYRQSCTT